VIVVIGSPIGRLVDGYVAAWGAAARTALAAAGAGRAVQLVGRIGDDPTADGLLLDLARGRVGHVAVLRDPARATPLVPATAEDDDEPADIDSSEPPDPTTSPAPVVALDPDDVELGLRYLTDFGVVVVAEPAGTAVVAVAAEAARWNDAVLILVVDAEAAMPDGLPAGAIVFEAPDDDPDGAFAGLVGHFAAAIDDGADPGTAFRGALADDGWTEAEPGED
jgi:sugar/nucleoside kinase (ribokinase family)